MTRVFQAFLNSFAGIAAALRHERAFRLEMPLALVLIPVACLLPITALESAVLIATVILVLVVELLNSSIEATVDRISLDRHPLSKRAKDLGSAAVFMSLVLVLAVWTVIVAPYYL